MLCDIVVNAKPETLGDTSAAAGVDGTAPHHGLR